MITHSKTWIGDEELLEYGVVVKNTFFRASYPGQDLDFTDFDRFHAKFGDPAGLPLPLGFTRFTASNNLSLSDPSTENFLRMYGRYMKFLTLYRCKWTLESFRRTLFEFTPNLEQLHLTCGIIPGTREGRGRKITIPELDMLLHEDPSDYPILSQMKSLSLDMNLLDTKDTPRPYAEQFLTEFLSSCPDLEELTLDIKAWYTRTWLTNFISTCGNISLKKLKRIPYIIDPDLSQVINLQMKQWPLSSLKIRIRYRDVTVEALHELLTSLKHTLTYLQIIFIDYKCAREFPSSSELYKLKKMELWKYKGQLDFLKDFASLEELLLGEIELKGQNLYNQRDMFKVLLPKLTKIEFKDYWEIIPFS